MKVNDVITILQNIKKTYGNAPCYLIGEGVASDTLDYVKVYGVNKVIFFNKKDDWTKR